MGIFNRKGRNRGVLLLVFSDTHVGSTLGLCPPVVYMEEFGDFHHNPAQALLWESYHDMLSIVAEHKQERKWPLVVIHNGDAVDGNHHGTHEIWTQDELIMAEVAEEVLAPAYSLADAVYMMRGTPSHVGKLARWEEALARELAHTYPIRKSLSGRYTWQHLNLLLNDVLFDVHHPPESGSRVPWTRGAEVNRVSTWLGIEYNSTGDRVPDVALRSHKHGFRDSGLNHKTRTFITPPWQIATSWANNYVGTSGKVAQVGGLLFFIYPQGDSNRYLPYSVEPIIYRPKRDAPEILNAEDFE